MRIHKAIMSDSSTSRWRFCPCFHLHFAPLIIIALLIFPYWTHAQSPQHAAPPAAPAAPVTATNRTVDVWLIPLDGFPEHRAIELQQQLARELGITIRRTLPVNRTPDMYFSRGKLQAEQVRSRISPAIPNLPNTSPRAACIILSPDDLTQAGADRGYVFVAHFPEQRLAILSYSRLLDTFYGMRDTPDTTRARLYKMTKMAIGTHYYQLHPTTNLNSVMYSPVETRYDLDLLGTEF